MSRTVAPELEDLERELIRAVRAAGAPEEFEPALERPRDPSHGDYASNAALVLAGRLGRTPRELATDIEGAFDAEAAGVSEIGIAGPGFLNFRLTDQRVWVRLPSILEQDHDWGRSVAENAERINVEFVSANPTGPLHVAHGRGAALGDAIASLLAWTGHDVLREFYVNDAGRQIDLLAESVEARFRQAGGIDVEVPEGGYHGSYVTELAQAIENERGRDVLEALDPSARLELFRTETIDRMRREQDEDLREFGVRMDVVSNETAIHVRRDPRALVTDLVDRDLAYELDGAIWFRTSRFGDEKDRVLIKSDGELTYFAPDLAYHLDKADRGFDRAIDVWGADHQGHVHRMQAALMALDHARFLEVVVIQLVTVLRGGVEARMSKRAGRFVTLRELFEETGIDVARYFFLMRRAEAALNFDLDLALDTSEANPVYRIQYAHARMCSVFRKGELNPEEIESGPEGLDLVDGEAERSVAKALLRFPEVLRAAARARAPHLLGAYLEDSAGIVNAWYHQGNLDPARRVLAEGPARLGRLKLARATQITLRNGLSVLGLSAPERMLREDG